jgi:transcriptional regulator with PAS, ATPase and Fis domain
MGPFSRGPFVVCNCAAVVDTLFEAEMFGHVKGSFTGAYQDRKGLFEAAEGGSLFLDEIGELSLTTQTKLLRALQFKEIRRVGSATLQRINVNVIAATNRDLRAMVQERQFREDLFYRLALVQIELPRLIDRQEDLPLLITHFVSRFAQEFGKDIHGLTPGASTVLTRYSWPGNVRELENTIGHACMMTSRENIDIADLPAYVRTAATERPAYATDLLPLAEIQRRHARYVLGKVAENKARAADILGISRTTLYKLLGSSIKIRSSQRCSRPANSILGASLSKTET